MLDIDGKILQFTTNLKEKIDPKNTNVKSKRKEELQAFLANDFKDIVSDYETIKTSAKKFDSQINEVSQQVE